MIFGDFPRDEAEGVMLAHSIRLPAAVFKKGRCLSAADLELLAAAGIITVSGARLAPDDLDENQAAGAVAALLGSEHLAPRAAHAGRCNLHAQQSGIVMVDGGVIDRLNHVDEAITIGTLPPYAPVRKGQVVATVKIIPFAVRQSRIAACRDLVSVAAPSSPLRLVPLVPHRVALIMSESSGTTPGILDKTLAVTRQRLEDLGSSLGLELRCPHQPGAIGAALDQALASGCELILVSGAAVTKDRGDVVPAAIVGLGGEISHFGMPVEPGNMLLLARIGTVPVINLPGCARSRRTNGFDWLLQRLLAKLPVGGADIMNMGVGGLIRSPHDEGEEKPVAAAAGPRVGAVVLAAGRSTRMGGANKLLCTTAGGPLVARAVDAACASRCAQVMVVTGFEAELVEAALAGRPVSFTHNPAFGQGMSSSLRCGLKAMPPDLDAVLVMLGDMPEITAGQIDRLLAAYTPAAPNIVVPQRDGRRGNPVLWPRRYFAEMCALAGDVGARSLLERHADQVTSVAISSDAIFADVDTPDALASLERR
ncbi:MAG TPA: molybdopterin-binding/glycosyltransferase family 2 protein [Rhodocyclaceae bacterium]|nr:molybdopterin-binding/glycosyltransferase family 2 protein [Rhodocyclaceae bacterium]